MLPACIWQFFHFLRNFSDVSPSHKKMDSILSDHLLLFQAFLQTEMTENQTQMHI